MASYWHEIITGLGWEDICAMHKITNPKQQHYVRECVLNGKPTTNFNIDVWRQKTGTKAEYSSVGRRPDRPIKQARPFGPNACNGKEGRENQYNAPKVSNGKP